VTELEQQESKDEQLPASGTFKVKVQKKIFFSDETGYAVCRVSVQGQRENTTIVGNLMDVNEGDFLEVEGEFVQHPRFGKQIKVNAFTPLMPEDRDGMIKFLSSGRFKGLGKKSAEKIVEYFGDSVFNILEHAPGRLKEVKGIQRRVIEDIRKNMKDNRMIRELTVKLSPYGIGNETIYKIYKEFKDDAFAVLESDPYRLIHKVRGVGFRIADTIAKSFGIEANDHSRVRAGIDFLVDQIEQKNGDIYMEELELIRRCAAMLDVKTGDVAANLNDMVSRDQLVREELADGAAVVMSEKNYFIEKSIANQLNQLSTSLFNLSPVEVDFQYIFKRTDVHLTEEQQDAVISAVSNRITIITGGPGTGKTTIIRAIIESLERDEKSVLVAAPTGRAAKRIEEATMYPASTIHRMLKISPETGRFVHNEQNPLKADAVIVDEFSMVDFYIFYSLLRAVSQHTRLIIIGDKDQLPSVGPGNVLRDIIGSGYFNIIYLSRNFRQTADSLIIENAYRINNGEGLIYKPYAEDLDFVFIKVEHERQALEKVLSILEYYKKDFHFNSPDFQVLVPMYRGEAGIDNANLGIQQRFNPGAAYITKEKFTFKEWDKVMQLRNNYEKEVFNGEQGIIVGYDKDKRVVKVDFDGNFKEYGADELDEVTLSYAVSVHKAQGSEYDMLILVLLPAHAVMLNRELFYTAVTRARKKIFLVSDRETVNRAILNASPSQRKTRLPRRLQEVFEPESESKSESDPDG
jgi:exodeoxyribonuclease V alpha subunit